MEDLLFFEIAAVIITAGVIALIAHFLRQPLIIAYIITGLLVGPGLLGIAESHEVFDALSEIGIAFLLFLVGLHLNWRNIKDVGKIAVMAGLGQIIFTAAAGWGIAYWLGYDHITSAIIGMAFAFSSTIIIVKVLSDKEDLDRFYGRISVGILIVQDIVSMILLLGLAAMRSDTNGGITAIIGLSLVKMAVVLIVLWFLARFVLPHVFRYAAHSQELLFLVALSWCFVLASGLTFFGFGIEAGALLAGISLASSGFQREIETKIRPLRDFFLVIFFIVLGTQLTVEGLQESWLSSLILSLFVLIGNPLIIMIVLRLFGYHPRTGFLVGVSLAQVSEFSFILLASAIATGLIAPSVLPMATAVAIITIAISSYFLKYNEWMFDRFEFLFRFFEAVPNSEKKGIKNEMTAPSILLFGYHDLGASILHAIRKMQEDYLVVDFDPTAIDRLEIHSQPHLYGDVGNREFLDFIKASKAKLIICTIPDLAITRDVIEYLIIKRSRAAIVVTAKSAHDARKMYEMGATFVIVPSMLGGELFSQLLTTKKYKKSAWSTLVKKQKKMLAVK